MRRRDRTRGQDAYRRRRHPFGRRPSTDFSVAAASRGATGSTSSAGGWFDGEIEHRAGRARRGGFVRQGTRHRQPPSATDTGRGRWSSRLFPSRWI